MRHCLLTTICLCTCVALAAGEGHQVFKTGMSFLHNRLRQDSAADYEDFLRMADGGPLERQLAVLSLARRRVDEQLEAARDDLLQAEELAEALAAAVASVDAYYRELEENPDYVEAEAALAEARAESRALQEGWRKAARGVAREGWRQQVRRLRNQQQQVRPSSAWSKSRPTCRPWTRRGNCARSAATPSSN